MSQTRMDDDLLMTPALSRRFAAEAEYEGGPGLYWGVVQRSNGVVLPVRKGFQAHEHQQMFAFDMVAALNREIHHDGSWAVLFVNPPPLDPMQVIEKDPKVEYDKFVILWVDPDGDPAFPVECEEPMWRVLECDLPHWIQQCENAWEAWRLAMREILSPREGQTYKRAQGQRAPSQH